ncbi:protein phosphatase 1 regulatory subunit 1A [Strigops habroptila]|nr:protein phosphatase 1 regulatory subunit 1A [Strigops habroptila]
MEPNSPRKIQFTVPLLEPHLDPEAAEQIRRRRPTPANLVLSSDQSSPEIDEDRLPNPLLKSALAMSPRQRKKLSRSTPTMKELQMMVEHHLCKQDKGEEEEEEEEGATNNHDGARRRHGDSSHSPTRQGGPGPGTPGDGRQSQAKEGTHRAPKEGAGKGAAGSQ